MKSMIGMYAGLAALMANATNASTFYPELSDDDKKQMVEKQQLVYNQMLIDKKGVKAFSFGDHIVLARNLKNAVKKAKSKGYI
jgi:hypothetical protein